MIQTTYTQNHSALTWVPANLGAINGRFERLHPRDVLRWGLTTFSDEIVLATGFGPSGIVLMHMVAQLRAQLRARTPIFYLQTDLFFPETITLRDRLAERLGIDFVEVHCGLALDEQAEEFGAALWSRNPDLCCHIRKVEPLRRYLAGKKAWITGIRRDQSPTRTRTQILSWDKANHLLKLNPLAGWRKSQVWDYIQNHDLPYNRLHDEGYPSIGCVPCTRAVGSAAKAGSTAHERDGRWAGTVKLECGIHIQAGD